MENEISEERRLLGLAQDLLGDWARGQVTPTTEPRGVVSKADALDALMSVVATLDEELQTGVHNQGRLITAIACAMAVRDYVEPLPVPLNPDQTDTSDPVVGDLEAVVRTLARAREISHRQP